MTFIAGVGMTPFGRHPERSLAELATAAVRAALADARVEAADVGAVMVGNAVQGAIEGQHGIRGQLMLRDLPLGRVPVVNVENACASASRRCTWRSPTSPPGDADVVLALGAEKMVTPDKERALVRGVPRRLGRGATRAHADRAGRVRRGTPVPDDAEERPRTASSWTSTRRSRASTCAPRHHARQFAAVAAKNHAHSVHNPLAQYRRAYTVDEVLAGRTIAWPLTLPMCSPVSDGAAAAVVCSPAAARRIAEPRGARAGQRARARRRPGTAATRRSTSAAQTALRLWERAGLGPSDVYVAEVHDATAVGEVQQVEHLGLVPLGEGGLAAQRGETALGGRIPVNPSGGLESQRPPDRRDRARRRCTSWSRSCAGRQARARSRARGSRSPRTVAG